VRSEAELCRKKDAWVRGTGCGLPVSNRCWLRGNWLLFRQRDKQCVNLTLLMSNGEAGLCHKGNSPTGLMDCKGVTTVTVNLHDINNGQVIVFKYL
jgi:hypothetical protein